MDAVDISDDAGLTSLLESLAERGGDELGKIFLLLSPAEACGARLLNRAFSTIATADGVWAPRLLARGFTSHGLSLLPAFQLFVRLHQREACRLELLRRHCTTSRGGHRRWWTEGALDLLNPFDEPVWLLFSAARPIPRAPSYLQPSPTDSG